MCVQVCTKYHGVYKVLIFGARDHGGDTVAKAERCKSDTHTNICLFAALFNARILR